MLPVEQREILEIDEPSSGGSMLEMRRTTTIPMQSPGDRITSKFIINQRSKDFFNKVSIFSSLDSPLVAPMYLPSPRIAHPHYYDTNNPNRIPSTEPPPAHRAHAGVVPPPTAYTAQSPLPTPTTLNLSHIQREREQREKEIERSTLSSKLPYSIGLNCVQLIIIYYFTLILSTIHDNANTWKSCASIKSSTTIDNTTTCQSSATTCRHIATIVTSLSSNVARFVGIENGTSCCSNALCLW